MACYTETGCCAPGVTYNCATLFDQALRLIGAPSPGVNNLAILNRWAGYEGARAPNNPLDTSQCKSPWCTGTCNWNSIPVRCYATPGDGAQALASTWTNGLYPAVLAALRRDAPLCAWSQTPIPAEIDTWGTHGFAAFLRTLGPCAGCSPACVAPATCVDGLCVSPLPGPTQSMSELFPLLLGGAGALLVAVHVYRRSRPSPAQLHVLHRAVTPRGFG